MNEPFAPHPYVIVASPSHHLAAKRRISMAMVVREPFLMREKGSDTRDAMIQAFGDWARNMPIAMELGSTETVKEAVIAERGSSWCQLTPSLSRGKWGAS